MGHYAAEMMLETPKGNKLRKEFFEIRSRLEKASTAKLSVGELGLALDLISDKNVPHHSSFEEPVWPGIREKIKHMKELLAKTK